MRKRARNAGWTMLLGGLLLIGAAGHSPADGGRDTTKIEKCLDGSAVPTFLTCRDVDFLKK